MLQSGTKRRKSPGLAPAGEESDAQTTPRATPSTAPRKVLHVITDVHGIGGAQTQLARLVSAMATQNCSSHVVSLVAGNGADVRQADDALGMRRGLPTPSAALRLRGVARRQDANLIQGWMYHGNLAAIFAARWTRRRVPLVWNVRHSLYDLSLEKPLTRAVIRFGAMLSSGPAAIVYNSETSARQHEAIGYPADRTVVIANAFDCDVFRPRPEARERLRSIVGAGPRSTLIGMAARNHPMKDAANLVRAMALLLAKGVDAHLVIVGPDYDIASLVASAPEAGSELADRITLLGGRDDMHEILPGLDILAVPSAWGEGFSNILGEAMASGLACVATDIGDSGNILGGHGIVVPPKEPEALAAALHRLIELGPESRAQVGEDARARVIANYSLTAIAEQYAELYEGLIGRQAAS